MQGRAAKRLRKRHRGDRLGPVPEPVRQSRPCPDPSSDRRPPPVVAALLLAAGLRRRRVRFDRRRSPARPLPRPRRRRDPRSVDRLGRPGAPSPSVDPPTRSTTGRAAGHRRSAVSSRPSRSRASSSTRPSCGRCSPRSSTQETPPAYLAAQRAALQGARAHPGRFDLRDPDPRPAQRGVAASIATTRASCTSSRRAVSPGAHERFYFAHEYDHALQDQNSTIFKDQHGVLDQGDRLLARQAIYEGDATLLMTQWAVANLTPSDLLEILAAGNDPSRQAVLGRTPAILQRHADLPVHDRPGLRPDRPERGRLARRQRLVQDDAGVDRADPPPRQVPDEAPVAVTLPADLATRLGTGWTVPIAGHVR